MKYNEDINPMKKAIGLYIEKYLKSSGEDYSVYTHVAIDECGDVFLSDFTPQYISNEIVWCIPPEYELFASETIGAEIIAYPTYEMDEYIKQNWKDLLFQLGPKEGPVKYKELGSTSRRLLWDLEKVLEVNRSVLKKYVIAVTNGAYADYYTTNRIPREDGKDWVITKDQIPLIYIERELYNHGEKSTDCIWEILDD